MVWGIAADDAYDDLIDYRAALGLTFPILFDEGGQVHSLYQQQTAYDQTIYPQDWLIDEAHNNTMLQWNKTVTIQNKFAFVTSSYTNQQVGGLTDKDFAYPAGCTKPCATKEELAQFVY